MSATRLMVLGVVRMYGRAHGYQVRRELLSWGVEAWAAIKPGSVYHALRRLLKEDLLSPAGVEGSAEGPDRALFALTDAGEAEFLRLVARALSDAGAKPEVFGAGIAFLPCLPRDQVVALLEHRIGELERERAAMGVMVDPAVMSRKPEHVGELFHWWVRSADVEIGFNRGLLDRIRSGSYVFTGEGPAFGERPGLPAADPSGGE